MSAAPQELFRELPSVDELLARPRIREWLVSHPRALVVDEIRRLLAEIRRSIREGEWREGSAPRESFEREVEQRLESRLASLAAGSLRRVVNATGVVLHTNLGRAPLSLRALEAVRQTAGAYSNLEYDLAAGRRGKRDVHAGALLERLLGSPAIVVNNNAAAVFLVLNELAAGGVVVVSRGELIEIGDGFRIPEIMERSGARLREVGTTNRTRIGDFRSAIDEHTRLLLRVHHSNFRISGFTARPTLEEMAALSRETGIPVMEDLGSGCLDDLSPYGFEDEPRVQQSLRAGIDLVTFSGDKLLGGPQAGVIAGRRELVERVRRNPLFRALRVDKLVYAALEATLTDYLFERHEDIPVLRMVCASAQEIRDRAERFAEKLRSGGVAGVELIEGESVLGGGSTPLRSIPTTLVSVAPADSAARLEERLRGGQPPVIARVEKDRLLIDLRTVFAEEENELLAALQAAIGRRSE